MFFDRGFTLIELLVTLAILSVLALVTVPITQVAVQRTKEQELRSGLREIRTAIDAYKRATDEGHVLRDPNASPYPKSLAILVDGIPDERDIKKPKMYFLRRIPRDPFCPDADTPAAATWGLRSYASTPLSPESGDDVFDVYSKSNMTGLNGIPYRQW